MITGLVTAAMAFLLSFGQAGLKPAQSAPASALIDSLTPANADYFAYLHWGSTLPGMWKALEKMETTQPLRSMPKVRRGIVGFREGLGRQLTELETSLGLDLIGDIDWIAAWVTPTDAEPEFLIAVHGKFPAELLDKLSALSRTPLTEFGGAQALQLKNGGPVLGLASQDVLIVGNAGWASDVIGAQKKRTKAGKGALARELKSLFKKKPSALMVSAPSSATRKRIRENNRSTDLSFLTDLIAGHKLMSFALFHNGVALNWQAFSSEGARLAALGLDGGLDLLRSSHGALRGMLKFGMAALRSYVSRKPRYARVLKHEAVILRYAEEALSGAKFKGKVVVDKGKKAVTLTAMGKRLSDVVPIGALIPAATIVLALSSADAEHGVETIESPAVR